MNIEASAEKTARKATMGAAGMSTFLLVLAIGFGLRGWQVFAAVALLMAVVGVMMAGYSYRRYRALRDARWQSELRKSEEALSQVLGQIDADKEGN